MPEPIKKLLGMEVGAWIQLFIMISVSFGGYYVSNEVAPLRVWQEDTTKWKADMDKLAKHCQLDIERIKIEHRVMKDTLEFIRSNDLNFVNKDQNTLEHDYLRKRLSEIEKDLREMRDGNGHTH